ncbi:MAG: alpha/beta fold hydrolase [Bacteroidota bacterium]
MNLNYKSFGQGPALIICHGLFGSLDNWVSHARYFSQHFSVFAVDLRNHGRSPHHPDWNYQIMAEDLLTFMDQQGIMEAHLLGHSMGGKVVMQAACYDPDRVDHLLVADMAPKPYEPHHTLILEALNELPLSEIKERQEANEILTQKIPEAGVRQFLLKSLGRDEEKKFRWKFNLDVISQNYEQILANIDLEDGFEGPTLFLSGGQSSYVRKTDEASILSSFPQATFSQIEAAGHWLHADSPDEFRKRVEAFLPS